MRNSPVTSPAIQADAPPFTGDGELDPSSALAWLPFLFGLLASVLIALILCPIPRSQSVLPAKALLLAASYVALTVATGAVILATCGILAARQNSAPFFQQSLRFCAVAAWIAPLISFYQRDSWWTILAAVAFADLGSALVYHHHVATTTRAVPLSITDFRSSRVKWLTIGALLLQLAVLFTLASMVGLAAIMIGSALFTFSLIYRIAFGSQSKSGRLTISRLAISIAMATLFAGASLVPYLAQPAEYAPSAILADSSQSVPPPITGRSPKPTHSLSQSSREALRSIMATKFPAGGESRLVDGAASARSYRALQALFGDGRASTELELNSAEKQLRNGTSTVVVTGESYPGMILRPEINEKVKFVAPVASLWAFGKQQQELQKKDPVAIPFYGAYWFFRTSDKTLPPNAIEARGDPRLTAFKTTDYTAMTMEARQNFGSLIDLSCCRVIEVVLSNADRRPGTVAVEVVLTNTRLPGKHHLSLGSLPVNSTLSWIPADNRPPVIEVLRFPVPEQSSIQSFDEITIRFALATPREEWSAKIGIEKFRLIPRGL